MYSALAQATSTLAWAAAAILLAEEVLDSLDYMEATDFFSAEDSPMIPLRCSDPILKQCH